MPAAIPLVMTGISVAQGISSQRKQADALKQQQRMAAQTNQRGGALFSAGMPRMEQSANYYGQLLNGSRASMTQAVQPEINAIGDIYRGAARGLERSGVRGASRDVATADLARERAGRTAQLIGGVRPMAAEALGKLGSEMTGQGQGYGRLGLGQQESAQNTRAYNDQQSAALWGNIGQLMTGAYGAWKNRGGQDVTGGDPNWQGPIQSRPWWKF